MCPTVELGFHVQSKHSTYVVEPVVTSVAGAWSNRQLPQWLHYRTPRPKGCRNQPPPHTLYRIAWQASPPAPAGSRAHHRIRCWKFWLFPPGGAEIGPRTRPTRSLAQTPPSRPAAAASGAVRAAAGTRSPSVPCHARCPRGGGRSFPASTHQLRTHARVPSLPPTPPALLAPLPLPPTPPPTTIPPPPTVGCCVHTTRRAVPSQAGAQATGRRPAGEPRGRAADAGAASVCAAAHTCAPECATTAEPLRGPNPLRSVAFCFVFHSRRGAWWWGLPWSAVHRALAVRLRGGGEGPCVQWPVLETAAGDVGERGGGREHPSGALGGCPPAPQRHAPSLTVSGHRPCRALVSPLDLTSDRRRGPAAAARGRPRTPSVVDWAADGRWISLAAVCRPLPGRGEWTR